MNSAMEPRHSTIKFNGKRINIDELIEVLRIFEETKPKTFYNGIYCASSHVCVTRLSFYFIIQFRFIIFWILSSRKMLAFVMITPSIVSHKCRLLWIRKFVSRIPFRVRRWAYENKNANRKKHRRSFDNYKSRRRLSVSRISPK